MVAFASLWVVSMLIVAHGCSGEAPSAHYGVESECTSSQPPTEIRWLNVSNLNTTTHPHGLRPLHHRRLRSTAVVHAALGVAEAPW